MERKTILKSIKTKLLNANPKNEEQFEEIQNKLNEIEFEMKGGEK